MKTKKAQLFTNYKLLTLLFHVCLYVAFSIVSIVNISLYWGYLVGLINFIVLALYHRWVLKIVFKTKDISVFKIIMLYWVDLIIIVAFLCYLFFINKLFLDHHFPNADGALFPINIITYVVAFIPSVVASIWSGIAKLKTYND